MSLHECETCSGTFSSLSALQVHVNAKHLKLKNFVCSYCNKRFGHQGTVSNHVKQVHKRIREHSCSECPYRAATRQLIEKHSKIHVQKREFTCKHCNGSFQSAPHLKSHIIATHGLGNKQLFFFFHCYHRLRRRCLWFLVFCLLKLFLRLLDVFFQWIIISFWFSFFLCSQFRFFWFLFFSTENLSILLVTFSRFLLTLQNSYTSRR